MLHIDEYGPGRIVVNGKEHLQDLILCRDDVMTWFRVQFEVCHDADVQYLIAENFKRFIVGLGPAGHEMEVPGMTRLSFTRGPIKIDFLPGEAAVKAFNEAKGEVPMMIKVRTTKPFEI